MLVDRWPDGYEKTNSIPEQCLSPMDDLSSAGRPVVLSHSLYCLQGCLRVEERNVANCFNLHWKACRM